MTSFLIVPGPEAYKLAADEHDAVVSIANSFINKGYDEAKTAAGGKEPAIAAVLKRAQELCQERRDSGDLDKNVRSAEYYLKSRWLVSTGDLETTLQETSFFAGLLRSDTFRAVCKWSRGGDAAQVLIMILGIGGNLTYDGIKAVAFILGWVGIDWLKQKLESTPGHPITPPGGSRWGASGAIDGLSDEGDKTGKPASMRYMDRTWIRTMTAPGGGSGGFGEMASYQPPGSSGHRPSLGNQHRGGRFGEEPGGSEPGVA